MNKVVERLDFVKSSGKDKWIAKCPAHDDSDPSLSIKELPDGRILMRCHAGCETANVVAALGLELSDLFPPGEYYSPIKERKREVVSEDKLFLEIWDAERKTGKKPLKSDIERYKLALTRLGASWA